MGLTNTGTHRKRYRERLAGSQSRWVQSNQRCLHRGRCEQTADLTAAQLKKHIALVVDGKVVWAPIVTYVAGPAAKNNVLTGSTPSGLTQEEVERIMEILPN